MAKPINQDEVDKYDLDDPSEFFQGAEARERFDALLKCCSPQTKATLTPHELELIADVGRRNGWKE